jgi:hypothetical protein
LVAVILGIDDCVAGMALAGAGRGLGDVAAVTLIEARARDEVRSRVLVYRERPTEAR